MNCIFCALEQAYSDNRKITSPEIQFMEKYGIVNMYEPKAMSGDIRAAALKAYILSLSS